MKIDEALSWARKELREVASRPMLEAEILLSFALGVDRIYLHMRGDEEIEVEEFKALVARRKAYEPIEYIIRRVSFYSEEFLIEPGVLIPRPETELLIDEVAKELRGDERVAEIGVGSGVVSIMLKKLFPNLSITATDINPKALELAAKNAKLKKVEIELVQTNLLDGIKKSFDVIVSNPPYIKKDFPLQRSVALYEPAEALFGGERGDEVLQAIIELFFKSKAKILACEMGYDQRASIERFVRKRGLLRFYRDLAGLDRGFILKKDRR